MPEPAPATPPAELPAPTRFWWLKRLFPAALIWLVVLCGLRWLWGVEADRRLTALIADAKARGEPILPQDFAVPTVPDSQNAAILYAQAASALVTSRQFDNLNPIEEFDTLPAAHLQTIAPAIATNAHVLQLVGRASTRPSDNWSFWTQSRPVPNRRTLETFLSWVALYRHHTGDDTEALSLAKDLLRLADSFDSGNSPFLDHYLSTYAQSYTINIAASVAFKPAQPAPSVPVVHSQLMDLIHLLLREDHYHRADVRAGYFLREHPISVMTQPDWERDWDEWLLRPMDELDGVKSAADFGAEGRAAECLNWPAAESQMPHYEPFEGSALLLFTRFQGRIVCGLRRFGVHDFFKATTVRRAGAIEIAIRLYQWDHAGRYPGTLDALVPTYLPSVPQDPMAADGRPFSYLPDNSPPIIYSVGSNGKDDGGSTDWKSPDEVFPLKKPSPKPRPTSRQAQQH